MTAYLSTHGETGRAGMYHTQWRYLTADTEAQVEGIVAELGLSGRWWRRTCRVRGCEPCPHWHVIVPKSRWTDVLRAATTGVVEVDQARWDQIIARRVEPSSPSASSRPGLAVSPRSARGSAGRWP